MAQSFDKESLWDKPGACKPYYIEKENYCRIYGVDSHRARGITFLGRSTRESKSA